MVGHHGRLRDALTLAIGVLLLGLVNGAAQAAPTNDDRAHARVISGQRGSLTQTTVGATQDFGSDGPSVWFRWRATHTGWETFDTSGSQAATWLIVYPPGSLTSGEVFWSRLFGRQESDLYAFTPFPGRYAVRYVRVVEGRDYYIQLWTQTGKANTVRLSWRPDDPPGRPANDDLADAKSLSGSSGVVQERLAGATYEPGESPLLDECVTDCGYLPGDHGPSVWFRWTPPVTGTWRFDNGEQGEWAWIQVYRGGPEIGGLTLVQQRIGYPGSYPSTLLDVGLTAGTSYRIRYSSLSDLGPFRLRWGPAVGGPTPPPPGNDDLAAATTITGSSGQVSATSQWATLEPGEPSPGTEAGSSVWYRWTAPSSGLATVGTPNYYLAVNIYEGSSLPDLQPVPKTYWGIPDRRPTFEAVEGTTYRIQVGGPFSYGMAFELTWDVTVPGNDDLAAAFPLGAGSQGVSTAWGVVRATAEPDEPATCDGRAATHTVWMRWQPSRSGRVTFDAFGDHTPSLDVFTGPAIDALTRVAGGPYEAEFIGTAGVVYWVRLNAELASIGYVGWHQKWDDSKPSVSAALDGGATRTRDTWVSLRLSGADTGTGLRGWLVSMATNSVDVLAPAWVPALGKDSRTVAWSVTHTAYGGNRRDGLKRVYVQAVDGAGNLSGVLTRSITLDR